VPNAYAAAIGKPLLTGKRILVVDDNAVNLDIATETLLLSGAQVDSAASGQEAIDLIKEASFDIVVLDLSMPLVDGFDVGRAMRASVKNAQTPLLLFTAADTDRAQQAVRELKADGLIAKPVDVDVLLDIVCKHAR